MRFLIGYGLFGAAAMLLCAAAGGFVLAFFQPYLVLVLFPLSGLLLWMAWLLLGVAQRLTVPWAESVLRRDPRAPVLLIQSSSDRQTREAHFANPVKLIGNLPLLPPLSLEQLLVRDLGECGPVITRVRPGERAVAGAARWQAEDQDWARERGPVLEAAQLIVVIPPRDPDAESGLGEDLSSAFRPEHRKKLLVVMPPVSEAEAQQRWQSLQRASGADLAPYERGEYFFDFTGGQYWVTKTPGLLQEAGYADALTIFCRWRRIPHDPGRWKRAVFVGLLFSSPRWIPGVIDLTSTPISEWWNALSQGGWAALAILPLFAIGCVVGALTKKSAPSS